MNSDAIKQYIHLEWLGRVHTWIVVGVVYSRQSLVVPSELISSVFLSLSSARQYRQNAIKDSLCIPGDS